MTTDTKRHATARHRFSFSEAARFASRALGTGTAFVLACATVVVWAVAGPFLGYSDSWQLTINTGTTVITFLMVFLIQNTQNREAQVTQLKLDELIRSIEAARNKLIDLEDGDDEDLAAMRQEFESLRDQVGAARKAIGRS